MLFIKSKDKKKFALTKCLPPDEISLALKIKRDNYINISYTSCINPIFLPPPATDYEWEDDNGHLSPIWTVGPPIPSITPATAYEWEDDNGHLSPIWTVGPPIPSIREHAQDVPATFIANKDIEIAESNDGEDSKNDAEDVSTDVSYNDDSDWEL